MATTALQLNTLADCEGVIERGMQTFIEVGMALKTIRDDRLYKADHSSFEMYCKERWGWVRQQSDRLIAAADVASVLTPIGVKRPTHESQVRPLTKLATPEEQQDVWEESWEEADKQGKSQPTGKIVQEVIDRRTGEVIEDAEIVKTQSQRLKPFKAAKSVMVNVYINTEDIQDAVAALVDELGRDYSVALAEAVIAYCEGAQS